MKFIIIGKQGCGKFQILDMLQEMGIRVGREFSNLPEKPTEVYIDPKYEYYSNEDVNNIFETKSYMYLGGLEESGLKDSYIYYKGLSHYTFDNSDVIAMSPGLLEQIDKTLIHDPILFVWLDNKRDHRIKFHVEDGRTHSFVEREEIESRYDTDFVKILYGFPNSHIIYFNNELPERVAAVVASCIKHPDLVEMFVNNFN